MFELLSDLAESVGSMSYAVADDLLVNRRGRTFEIDPATLAAMADLRDVFGVTTSAQVIRKALAFARVCAEFARLEGGFWLVDFLNEDGSKTAEVLRSRFLWRPFLFLAPMPRLCSWRHVTTATVSIHGPATGSRSSPERQIVDFGIFWCPCFLAIESRTVRP
jgi:hypothetical protein